MGVVRKMKKFIKVKDNNYTYINVDYIVIIYYTPIEYRLEQYKDEPVDVMMENGLIFKISNEDAEILLNERLENEKR